MVLFILKNMKMIKIRKKVNLRVPLFKLHPICTTLLCVIFLAQFILIQTLSGQPGKGWQPNKELIEKLTKLTPHINYYEEKVPPYTLPDVLVSLSGKRIANREEWVKIRRPELLAQFAEYLYGKVPETPYQKEFKIVNNDPMAMNGKATLKQVSIIITAGEKSLTINLILFTPNNIRKPVPTFMLICNRGSEYIDPSRSKKFGYWPAEEAIERGYGIAAFLNADVDPDKFDGFKDGIHGMLDGANRPPDAWATIAAWAWGASRCMDYLQTDKDVAGDKIAVVGQSRGGKTALWAGATDERFALVIPNDAGCGGDALSKRIFGETVASINKSFPHWFCENFKKFSNAEDKLPVDQHMLLALIAPRALYTANASNDLWADPKGQYLSLFHSLPVYRLYNPVISIPESMPPVDTPVRSGNIGYHIRSGDHDLTLADWNFFMDHADKVFVKKNAHPGGKLPEKNKLQ
jgi:hypothetical protein